MRIRLDRWLAALDLGSRSQVKELIRRGAVAVDGKTVKDPAESFEPGACALAVSGRPVDGRTERHVMLHKPGGVLTAARDPKQPTVMDLLDGVYASLECMPVGRLDKDTTGILILTTDGELNHRLLAPGRHVDKVYEAEVTGRLTEKDVAAFAEGLELSDFRAEPASLEILEAGEASSRARVTVHEGKFHQVKRMFSAVGHEVTRLHRRSFGPLELDPDLPEGQARELTAEELRLLKQAAGMEEA